MNDVSMLVVAWVVGVILGTVFFVGLWWTVRQGVSSRLPWLWFSGSLVLRMGIVIAGFVYVAGSHWERVLLCLVGFIMARLAVTWLTRSVREVSHAPIS